MYHFKMRLGVQNTGHRTCQLTQESQISDASLETEGRTRRHTIRDNWKTNFLDLLCMCVALLLHITLHLYKSLTCFKTSTFPLYVLQWTGSILKHPTRDAMLVRFVTMDGGAHVCSWTKFESILSMPNCHFLCGGQNQTRGWTWLICKLDSPLQFVASNNCLV